MAVVNAVVSTTNDDSTMEVGGVGFSTTGWGGSGVNYAGDFTGGVINHSGARFVLGIAQGSVISSAIPSIWGLEAGSLGTIGLRIYCEDVDNAGAWAGGTHEPHNFTTTSGFVAYAPATFPFGQYNVLPDIAAEVQKVVDRAGFGGAVAVGIRNNAVAGGWIGFADYSENAAHAPKLDVTYTSNSAVLSGTITAATTEADIVAGAKTIVLTLSGSTWIAN